MIIESEITGVLGFALQLSVLALMVSVIAAAYRLFVGPTLADRVIALDLVSMLLVVFLVVFKFVSQVNAYMYVAIGLALISIFKIGIT